jgi:NitT/TauT family transport system substrate-binding protein
LTAIASFARNLLRATASFVLGVVVLAADAFAPAQAEAIKIGTLKIAAYSPMFIAQEKGYFAAEGLNPELVYFDSAEPVAVGVASGSLDFGLSGTSGGLYSLCGQGALRIIAGGPREVPGFQFFVVIASNRSDAAGLKSYKDLAGHAVAVSQIGSPTHYSLALIEEKYGLDPATIRVLPLQSVPNQLSAVSGGQADATIANATVALPVVQRGDAKLIGSVGDETPWQIGVVYAATKMADDRRDTVERFLRAYRKGARDYHDAVTGADGKRADGPATAAIMAIIAQYTGQTIEQIKLAIAYNDAEARLDVKDLLHQIAWFKAQNMVKGPVNGQEIIDPRYVIPLPER